MPFKWVNLHRYAAVLNQYGIFQQVDILCDAGPREHPVGLCAS